ncbi:MAG: XdhC family protein, partial [Acidobacteria bacterium]
MMCARPRPTAASCSGAWWRVFCGNWRRNSMDEAILRSALAAVERGASFALVTVIEADGSSPGKPGQKMIVFADGRQEGTVGGGRLELTAAQDAARMLHRGRGGILTYALDSETEESLGVLCGGRTVLAVEVHAPSVRLLLCGAGHVASHLARLCPDLGFVHTVVEARPEMANAARYPFAAEVVVQEPSAYIADRGLEGFTHVVILTHNHELDRAALLAVHKAGFRGYAGMIGSANKWRETR